VNFPFKFIVIGRLNIWQLVQLVGFSKTFTGLLHFCDWYFSSRNMNVTSRCCLYYSEFPKKVLPILKWNKFEGWMSDTTLKSWVVQCISKDYFPSSTIWNWKNNNAHFSSYCYYQTMTFCVQGATLNSGQLMHHSDMKRACSARWVPYPSCTKAWGQFNHGAW
jgi:hypothetical protein